MIKAFWGKASPGAVGREDTVGEGSRQQAVRCVTTGSAMTQSKGVGGGGGKEAHEGGTHMPMSDSHCCTAETNTTL